VICGGEILETKPMLMNHVRADKTGMVTGSGIGNGLAGRTERDNSLLV
jgi:hypothetical protein